MDTIESSYINNILSCSCIECGKIKAFGSFDDIISSGSSVEQSIRLFRTMHEQCIIKQQLRRKIKQSLEA